MIVTVTPNPVLDRTLTVPRILFDEVTRATDAHLDWGGKGFNVSRALQELGMDSVAMGFVGGATGEALRSGLEGLGIATDLLVIAGETRTNVVIREADTPRYIKVNEAGPIVQPEEWRLFLELARERAQRGDIWVLAGSLPPGVPADFYAQLVELLRERGAQALLDTSGEPLRQGCAAHPLMVKPNAHEAQELTGIDITPSQSVIPDGALDAAIKLLRQGINLVALSLGAEGLLLSSTQEAVWARCPGVVARNPTGAGDALLAGIVWALARGLPLEEMARWGVAAGTASAVSEAVSGGTRDQVGMWYERVQIRREERWGLTR